MKLHDMRLSWLLLFMMLFLSGTGSGATMITGVLGSYPAPDPEVIRLETAFDVLFTRTEQTLTGNDIRIYCRWTNTSDKPQQFLLKDHDDYHGILDYPWGLTTRIETADGACLTDTVQALAGWYDSSVRMSQLSKVNPGDVVELLPGERVVRSMQLMDMLFGLTFVQAAAKSPVSAEGVIDMTQTTIPPFQFSPGANVVRIRFLRLESSNQLIIQHE